MKIKHLMIPLVFLLLFCACSSPAKSVDVYELFNFDALQYVTLADYNEINIDNSLLEISSKDIETIIGMDLSSNEIYKEVKDRTAILENDIVKLRIISDNSELFYVVGSENFGLEFDKSLLGKKICDTVNIITDNMASELLQIIGIYQLASINDEDIVLDYYNLSNLQEVKEYITKRAQEEITYNYFLDYILDKSLINSYPQDKFDDFVLNDIASTKMEAKKLGYKYDEFLNLYYGLSTDDYKQEKYNELFRILIVKSVLEKENVIPDKNIFYEKLQKYIQDNNIKEENVKEYELEIYYIYLTNDLLRPIIS